MSRNDIDNNNNDNSDNDKYKFSKEIKFKYIRSNPVPQNECVKIERSNARFTLWDHLDRHFNGRDRKREAGKERERQIKKRDIGINR